MSSSEIQNLLVRIEPEGVDQTTEDLQQQGEQFEETADVADEQSGRLEDFSERWAGAMTTIVAGLAVAAAGLLTQVPVLGEVLGGLVAVIEAIAFQMDQVLRPVLQPLTQGLFALSGAIFQLDGIAGDIVGVLASIGAALGVVVAAVKLLGGSLAGVVSFLSGLGPTIAGVSAGLLGMAAAVGAIIGLIGVLILEVTGVLDWFEQLGQQTREILLGMWGDLKPIVDTLRDLTAMAIGIAINFLNDPLGTVTAILDSLKDIAEQTWNTIVEIVMELENPFTTPIDPESATGQVVQRTFPDAFDANQRTRSNIPSPNQTGGSQSFAGSLIMNGRLLTEETGRYDLDKLTRRAFQG